jgi:hypothetical protein
MMNKTNSEADKLDQLAAAADVLTKLGDGLSAVSNKSGATTSAEGARSPAGGSSQARRALNGADIAALAKEQMIALTGLSANTVSGLCKDEQGWHVVLDMIELKRIPASSDVLATYDVVLDAEGNLVSYRRTRRYYRGSTEEEQ